LDVGAPEDGLLRALLARLFADRQLRLTPAVRDWLLLRLPRTASAMSEAVARLDAAALDAHRDITVPLAREVLGELAAVRLDDISGTAASPSRHDPSVL
jgi:chromosomal replication initiation ATPase DnaA